MEPRRLSKDEQDAVNRKMDARTLTDEQVKSLMSDPDGWRIVVEAAGLGDMAAHEMIGRATKLYNAGAPCANAKTGKIETLSASSAKKNIEKAQRAEETNMIHSEIAVHSLRELAQVVAKGVKPGMKLMVPDPDSETGYREFPLNDAERWLAAMARESQGTEQMFSPGAGAGAKFPSGASIVDRPVNEDDDSLEPLKPYTTPVYPGVVRVGPFVVANPNMDPALARAENFDAPEPKDRHDADHADVNAMRSSPVMKSGRVAKGLFAGTAADMGAVQEHERHTGRR